MVSDEAPEAPREAAMTDPARRNYLPVRQDWLDRRREPAIEPDYRSSTRTIICGSDRAGGTLDEFLADITSSGHNIVATVFMQCQAMYRADGDAALRPVGETEFVNGIAAAAQAELTVNASVRGSLAR